MFRLVITHADGRSETRELIKAEVSIGRVAGNDVVLPGERISKRHARITYDYATESFVLFDERSTNGTSVNGELIDGPHTLQPGDQIFLGDFTIEVIPSGVAPLERTSTGEKRSARRVARSKGDRTEEAPEEAVQAALADQRQARAAAINESRFDDGFGEAADDWDEVAAEPPSPAALTTVPPGPPTAPQTPSIEALLQRYVEIDEAYSRISFGRPCTCGTCLTCCSKEALRG